MHDESHVQFFINTCIKRLQGDQNVNMKNIYSLSIAHFLWSERIFVHIYFCIITNTKSWTNIFASLLTPRVEPISPYRISMFALSSRSIDQFTCHTVIVFRDHIEGTVTNHTFLHFCSQNPCCTIYQLLKQSRMLYIKVLALLLLWWHNICSSNVDVVFFIKIHSISIAMLPLPTAVSLLFYQNPQRYWCEALLLQFC